MSGRRIIVPFASRNRQRGAITFVTNPFLVGFPVGQPGAGFSSGEATVEAQGTGIATAAASSLGTADAQMQGTATIAAAGSSAGVGTAQAHNSLILVDAADFDGTNDYMSRGAGLTGAVDSKLGIFSGWLRLDGGDGAVLEIINDPPADNKVGILRSTGNKLGITAKNAAGATILTILSVASHVAGASWIHLLMSWDMAGGAGGRHLYVDGVSDINVVTFTDDTIDYTLTDWGVGASSTGANKFNGALAEVYFAPGQYLDFSVESNRRKFRSTDGKPVYLGVDGSLPTGTAPLVYQHLDDGEAVANFATNRGNGGNFTITGTLDIASSSPSD